ncbi:MAG: hypothetical protein N2Z20_04055 [Elusimicrobiales bacterium]|nr:hypothetical protein [Elusimicrobiales bacterium]
MKKSLFLKYFLIFIAFNLLSQEQKNYKFPPVKYVSLVKDLNKYYLYANGGFHADWYVGYNNAWIIKLPPTDISNYIRAFIGVKLGRAKIISYPSSSSLKPRESKIFVTISNTKKFSPKTYILCENSDIPLEPIEDESIEGVDSAKWFWTEIPLTAVSSTSYNYIAIWAESRELKNSFNSPIIAAANLDDKEENVWVNPSIKGAISAVENPFEIPIYGIKPAIVIKLIPQNDYKVIIKNFNLQKSDSEYFFSWSVISADPQKSWLEISYDKIKWDKFSKYIFNPPYAISFSDNSMPNDLFYIKACALDMFENLECSNHITINNISKKKEE